MLSVVLEREAESSASAFLAYAANCDGLRGGAVPDLGARICNGPSRKNG
jgi:hypothetical protein